MTQDHERVRRGPQAEHRRYHHRVVISELVGELTDLHEALTAGRGAGVRWPSCDDSDYGGAGLTG